MPESLDPSFQNRPSPRVVPRGGYGVPVVAPPPIAPVAPPTPVVASPSPGPPAAPKRRLGHRLVYWLVLAGGAGLCLASGSLWIGSGGLSSDVVTSGTVVSNSLALNHGSGFYAVKIQFAAGDGQQHSFIIYSPQPERASGYLIGKTFRVVYGPKTPDSSGRLWSAVSQSRQRDLDGLGAGAVLLAGVGVSQLLRRRRSSTASAASAV